VSSRAAELLAPVVEPALGRKLVAQTLLGEGTWLDGLRAAARLEPRVVPYVVEALRTEPTEPARATAARTSAPSSS
jgi:hypothetical protein